MFSLSKIIFMTSNFFIQKLKELFLKLDLYDLYLNSLLHGFNN